MSPPTNFPVIHFRADDYNSASEGLRRVHEGATLVHSTLVKTLNGFGGMAGSDSAGQTWSASYDEAAAVALDASSKLITTSGRIGDLIATGSYNHALADANAHGSTPPPVPSVIPDPCLNNMVPSAKGGDSDEPFGWSLVKSAAGLVWPNGHQDQLRAARDIWYAAAAAMDEASNPLPRSVEMLQNSQSDEIPAAVAKCSATSSDFVELQLSFQEMGDACSDYANELDKAHSEILTELGKMLLEVGAVEVGLAILAPFTGTLSEWFGNAGVAARIATYTARIAAIINRLVAKAVEIAGRIGGALMARLRRCAASLRTG